MRIIQRPYHLLLLAGIILLLSSFFTDASHSFDIHVHDTMYVIAQTQVHILLASVLWVLWLICIAVRKILVSPILIWIHVVITILAVLSLNYRLFLGTEMEYQRPVPKLDSSVWKDSLLIDSPTKWILYSIVGFLVGQISLLINLLLGVLRWKTMRM